jgi:hypothetical protein
MIVDVAVHPEVLGWSRRFGRELSILLLDADIQNNSPFDFVGSYSFKD